MVGREDHEGQIVQGRLRRTLPLAGFTARTAGSAIVAALRDKAGDPDALVRFHEASASRYTELLGHSKGVLMKAGQLVSVMNPGSSAGSAFAPYQAALSQLQSGAPPMDWSLAKGVLESDLGRPIASVFDDLHEEPIAAASIGQVHRATLNDGRKVAVKIQYPGVAEAIKDDLSNLELLVSFLRIVSAASGMRADLKKIAQEIAGRITEELDYRNEASNIVKFGNLYRGHPFIRVPEVVQSACGDRVLTMTLLDGMDWAAAQEAEQGLKDTWAEAILRFSLGNYRHSNLFQADPHPGNYVFGADGQVGFVDFGCITELAEAQRHRLVAMVRAVLDGRRQDARKLMVEAGFFTEDSSITEDSAHDWWVESLHEIFAPQPFTYSADTSKRAMQAMLDGRSKDNPVRQMSVPEGFVFMSRVSFSIHSICAALGARVHVRSLFDDMDGVASPVTRLGEMHHEWVDRRGLPHGLERHVQPSH